MQHACDCKGMYHGCSCPAADTDLLILLSLHASVRFCRSLFSRRSAVATSCRRVCVAALCSALFSLPCHCWLRLTSVPRPTVADRCRGQQAAAGTQPTSPAGSERSSQFCPVSLAHRTSLTSRNRRPARCCSDSDPRVLPHSSAHRSLSPRDVHLDRTRRKSAGCVRVEQGTTATSEHGEGRLGETESTSKPVRCIVGLCLCRLCLCTPLTAPASHPSFPVVRTGRSRACDHRRRGAEGRRATAGHGQGDACSRSAQRQLRGQARWRRSERTQTSEAIRSIHSRHGECSCNAHALSTVESDV